MKESCGPIVYVIILITLGLSGCYYDEIPADIDIDREVSFSNDIVPILNQSCNQSGCHASGDIDPDLSEEQAYESIVDDNLVDPDDPEGSDLYLHLTGTNLLMPPAGKLPDTQISLVLAWIKQGAKEN